MPTSRRLLQRHSFHGNTRQYTATHCNTLQHTATHTHSHVDFQTNLLQRHSFHCNTWQHSATRCTTLQHTATHCNTLQHTQPRRLPDESVSARQSLRYTFSKSQSVTQFTALNYHRSDFPEISTKQKKSQAPTAH